MVSVQCSSITAKCPSVGWFVCVFICSNPILDRRDPVLLLLLLCMSRSGYPPWILKRGGLESSGWRPNISLIPVSNFLPTLVAKWLERWQTCSASLRTAFMFGQKLESDHGWIVVCTNEWCYKYIHMQIPVLVVGRTRSKLRLSPTPGLTPTGTLLPYRSTPC